MRYKEISQLPGTPEEAENAVLDLVAVYQSHDVTEIPMNEILGVLHDQGFDADRRWVMDALQDKPGISRIEKDKVVLHTDEPTGTGVDDKDFNRERVKGMAAKSARKSIDNG
jgi:hypothetical protein